LADKEPPAQVSTLYGKKDSLDPYRIAIALLYASLDSGLDLAMNICDLNLSKPCFILQLLQKHRWSPLTTSAVRLFDGVASIGLGDVRPNHEGECAMQ